MFNKKTHRGATLRCPVDVQAVYISGPMRDYEAFNFPAFFEAEAIIRERFPDAVIMNPAREDVRRMNVEDMLEVDPTGRDVGRYLQTGAAPFTSDDLEVALGADLGFVLHDADLVVVLPGWRGSKGATAEVATANAVGTHVASIGNVSRDVWVDSLRVLNPHQYADLEPAEPDVEPEDEDKVKVEIHVDESREPVAVVTERGEVRTTSATGGQKGVKLAAFDQISPVVEKLIAEHFGKGARKYSAHNFRKGYEWSKSYSALRRHLADFWAGKEYDTCDESCPRPEAYTDSLGHPCCRDHTGSLEIVAVCWHAMVLAEFFYTHPEFDDRYSVHPEYYSDNDGEVGPQMVEALSGEADEDGKPSRDDLLALVEVLREANNRVSADD